MSLSTRSFELANAAALAAHDWRICCDNFIHGLYVCRDLATAVLRSLGVEAVKYDYSGNGSALRDCTASTYGTAFILIDSGRLSQDSIRVFTDDESKDSDGGNERSLIRALNESMCQPFDRPVSSCLGSIPSALQEYEAAHIIGCENLQKPQKPIEPQPRPNSDRRNDLWD